MQYDPIKRSLGKFFNKYLFMRKLFYRLLDLLLLRSWHIHKELRKFASEKKGKLNVLDAGSGFGQYSYFMASKYPDWTIHGVDVKQEQVDDCNVFFGKIGRENVSFDYADLTQFKVKEKYDMALSVDVMEHILEDVQVFKNISQSLKKGGVLYISTPSDQGGSDVHDHDHESFIDEHVRDGYGKDEIKEKLKKGGFSRSFVKYSYGWPGKISWKLSMKWPILMLNASKLFFIIIPFYYLITYPFAFIFNLLDVNIKHKTGTGLIVKAVK